MRRDEWIVIAELTRQVSRDAGHRPVGLDDVIAIELLTDSVAGALSYFSAGRTPDDLSERLRVFAIRYSEVREALLKRRFQEDHDILMAGYMLWAADVVMAELSRAHQRES